MSFNVLIKETEKLLVDATPQRKFQLNKRLELIENLKTRASKINGAKEIEKLILKKDKTGRPFFSEYLEKLDLLEDLQNKKYTNPKTKKPFTPKEWLGSTASYRSKFRDPESFLQKKKEYQKEYMAEKKKDPTYKKEFLKKKKEEYFKVVDKKYKVDKGAGKAVLQMQDNKLLAFLLTAANKQKKNLKGNIKPQFEEIIKDKKFAGVKDNKTGITYHHARYKGPLGVNDRLITDHPEFNKVKDLTKIADSFKRSLPNTTIASYFAKYDRVPTNAELYNFLSKDPDLVSKYSTQAMSKNPLELHHRLGVEVAPDKSIQLTPQVKNNTAGVIVEEFKKGNISKDEAAKQLKKINVRVKLPGTKSYIGAKDIAPTQAVGAAKREVSKMFLERIKEDPNVVDKIVDAFALKVKSIPGGCRAVVTRALGGPIDACEAIIKADPKAAAVKLNNAITATKGPLKELKETSKQVANLIDTGQVTTASNLPRPDDAIRRDMFKDANLRYNSELGAFENVKTQTVAPQSEIKQYAVDNPMEVKVGEPAELPKPNKSVLKTVGKTLAAVGAPLPTALLDTYFINEQIKQDKTTSEIVSNPLNWLGLATMSPLSRAAGIDKAGKVNTALRLGLNPGTIRGISRFVGLPGLALSTAMTAYDQYTKYKNQEGFIYKLFNKEES